MTGTYDDGMVVLDRRAITLRRYHFPSGTAKVIPLSAIRGYRAEPLGMLTHRFRIWGSSDLRRWLPLDIKRPVRTTLITLDLEGTPWPQPAFTPADPERFCELLDELLAD
ncbi:PH domain-containing protein [[Mycobacterium] nativiensis]|uniref:PH domain-containing protein n=1 Tax=[Mycobacterium] nativiensis TaxID=2855503 RepID=A0ABU5Y0D8_9MYCO|nr:PH domain-containing protein [Mycolicibacter sp. MYC340]MEB3033598.1 PH domain-containing protein [Mycolicibacter sp. MYC340]